MTDERISIWVRFWRANGGMWAPFRSHFFWVAIALTVFGSPFWTKPGWWDVPLSVLPNLLGFSLGGTAILFGVVQLGVFRLLKKKTGKSKSSYMSKFLATFTYFVLVQAIALTFAVFHKSAAVPFVHETITDKFAFNDGWPRTVFFVSSSLGWFLFVYSIVLTIAAAIEVFRLSEILQDLTEIVEVEESKE